MKKFMAICLLAITSFNLQAQDEKLQNSDGKMVERDQKFSIGGYAQIDYNQPFGNGTYNNGILDVHRMVLLLGYKFNEKTKFVTELELEHVKEAYVEQAFLDYSINPFFTLRAGLMLIPMGLMNEYHEPPTYNGVERPFVDSYISPTTWREIGIGFNGRINEMGLRYQAYLVNGFKSYGETAMLSGDKALRGGRQKGAESIISKHPNLAIRADYFGTANLNLGFSAYFGKTQSALYNRIAKDDPTGIAKADSSVIGLAMLGADFAYSVHGVKFVSQFYYAKLNNVEAYNTFTGKDLGENLLGYYAELSYNLLHSFSSLTHELLPFVRYEKYNTHFNSENANASFNRNALIAGLGWKIHRGAIFKADVQFLNSEADRSFKKQVNFGLGIWF